MTNVIKKKTITRSLALLLALTLLVPSFPTETKANSASSAIVMEQKSGRVLYEKAAHTQRRIASITKIMTAILAIESGKMDDTVTISDNAAYTEGSSIYLKPGNKVKLEDLVYGLMLRSGNDSAVAIAEHVAGSLEDFCDLMNKKAQSLGMTKSYFSNPHGLDDHEKHYSTAYDMALLTRYALENDEYKKIAGTKVYKTTHPSGKGEVVWHNKNRMLTKYPHSTGGKTGYTRRAKRTLVSTAEKDGFELIAVTLNDPNDWNDHISMFERAYNGFKLVKLADKGIVTNIEHPFFKQHLYVSDDFFYPLTHSEKDQVRSTIELKEPNQIKLSIIGIPSLMGKRSFYIGDKLIGEQAIFYK